MKIWSGNFLHNNDMKSCRLYETGLCKSLILLCESLILLVISVGVKLGYRSKKGTRPLLFPVFNPYPL